MIDIRSRAAFVGNCVSLYKSPAMARTLLFGLCILPASAFAQDYLANDPVWRQHSICGVPAPCIASDTYNYFTAGDSLIDGITWTKVQRFGVVNLNWQSPDPPQPSCAGTSPYNTDYHGVWLIRQQDRQLRILIDGVDSLLFEFDLQVGQTLPLSYTNWNTDITVLAVDQVQIGTETRSRYELGNSWAQYLIEGVGSSHGLFEPISNFFDCGYGLDCFGLGAESFYPEEWEGGCELMMGTGAVSAAARFGIAPNPAADNALVTGLRAGAAVTLTDALGRTVRIERADADRLQMDLSNLPEGCYVVNSEGRSLRLQVVR